MTIIAILPPREGFSPTHFGAVALCVKDFCEYSRFAKDIQVLGGVECEPFPGIAYRAITPKKSWFSSTLARYAKACAGYIRTQNATLIELHNRPAMAKYLAACGVPVAVHLHNDPQTMAGAKTAKERNALMHHCQAVYCVSEYIRQQFLAGLDVAHHAQVHTLYNGLHIPETIPGKDHSILLVGRMAPKKGTLPFLQAIQQLDERLGDWKVILVGAHKTSGPEQAYIKQCLDSIAAMPHRITYHPRLPHEQTMQLFANAAIAAIPSTWEEPFGRTALEAMSRGCAVISSVLGGLDEVIGDAAIRLESINATTIAQALEPLLTDATLRNTYSNKAHVAAKKFAIEDWTARLDGIREALQTPSSQT